MTMDQKWSTVTDLKFNINSSLFNGPRNTFEKNVMFAESFFLLRNVYSKNLIFQIVLPDAMSLLGQHVTKYTRQWDFEPYQTYLKFYIVRHCCRRIGKLFLGTVISVFLSRKIYVFWLNKYSFLSFNFPGNVARSSVMSSWGYCFCISLSRWLFKFGFSKADLTFYISNILFNDSIFCFLFALS